MTATSTTHRPISGQRHLLLERAVATSARKILVATHVPPFLEALPRTGRLAHRDWQPLLVCAATGTVISQFAATHPGREFLVLGGHTHAATDVTIAANARCRVLGARGLEGIGDRR